MRDWVPRRDEQLAVVLAAAAPKDTERKCLACDTPNAKWQCQMCFGRQLLCLRCCATKHKLLPFHRIEKWNGKFFQAGALWQVGVKLYLGHDGGGCSEPQSNEGLLFLYII